MAYVPAAHSAPGMEFDVDVRGPLAAPTIVPLRSNKRPRG